MYKFSRFQTVTLLILRVLIGWHFLYEGLSKLLNPHWTSNAYLLDSSGFLAGFFHSLASNPDVLNVVDLLNIWGLILIGSGLILGVFTRLSTVAGIVLLAFYYLSHPPMLFQGYEMPTEGSYFLVDKNLIEMAALVVLLFFPTGRIIGLDRLLFGRTKK